MAYFREINDAGGIDGRRITLKLYDDGYQPDPCVQNTLKLMLEDDVFLLFGYVGTPTVTRVLPMLKKFQEEQIYMFFPFTGAQPQREPPYGDFAFNLRASYRQETAGLVENFLATGRRRIAVFYQADAYGRSGWAGVRAALENHGEDHRRRGDLSAGRPFHRHDAGPGRNPPESGARRRDLRGGVRRLRRVRPGTPSTWGSGCPSRTSLSWGARIW